MVLQLPQSSSQDRDSLLYDFVQILWVNGSDAAALTDGWKDRYIEDMQHLGANTDWLKLPEEAEASCRQP